MSWRMEVESEDGSDAKYYTESRAVVGALCTPITPDLGCRLHRIDMDSLSDS